MKLLVIGDAASVNVRRWCEGLSDGGVDVEVASFTPADWPGIRHHRLAGWYPGRTRYVLGALAARRLVRDIRPDLVVGYYVTGYGTLAALAGWHPLVQVTAGNDVLVNPPGSVTHYLARRNLAVADLVVAWAPHMAVAAQRLGVPHHRILTLPRGIPVDRFSPSPRPRASPPRLITTRALERFYRHDVVLRALASLPDVRLQLTIAGGGRDRAEIERLRDRLGLAPSINFAGYVDDDALPGLLATHDIYVSASPSDGVSASLLEAMACGLLPVVVDHDANTDWVRHGENGLLYPGGDPAALADALSRAATDPDLQARAALHNPQIVRVRANLQTNMSTFVHRFRELVARCGGT